MDWASTLEVLAPLLVALFAVRLGYRYQRVLSDRESRRQAYISLMGHLSRMMDCIEQAEHLSFIRYTLHRPPSQDPKSSANVAALEYILSALADLGATLDPERAWARITEWDPNGPDDLTQFVGGYPGYIWSLIHARFEEERRLVRDEGPRILVGRPPLGRARYHRSTFVALRPLVFQLVQVYHAITPEVPARVEWKPINQLYFAFQKSLVRDLGVGTAVGVTLIQFRERLPWPEGTPFVKLPPPPQMTGVDDGVDWEFPPAR